MRVPGRTVDEELARMADARHGLATRAELLAAGVTSKQIDARVKRGNLIPVHRDDLQRRTPRLKHRGPLPRGCPRRRGWRAPLRVGCGASAPTPEGNCSDAGSHRAN